MSKKGQSTKSIPPVDLTVAAERQDNALYMQTILGSAELEDGSMVEIGVCGGSTLLTHHDKDQKTWRTYVLTGEALVRAVLRAERAHLPCKNCGDNEADHSSTPGPRDCPNFEPKL